MQTHEGATASDANETSPSSTLAEDVAFLKKVSESAEQDPNGENVAALVQQLDKAAGVAQGVEGRLDKLIENLEKILGDLEEGDAEEETKEVATSSQGLPDT